MSGIALPAFHITATRKHTLEFPHFLQQELEAYRAFYKQTYGADVTDADLIRETVRCFLASDEGFRAFKNSAASRSRSRAKCRAETDGLSLGTAGQAVNRTVG